MKYTKILSVIFSLLLILSSCGKDADITLQISPDTEKDIITESDTDTEESVTSSVESESAVTDVPVTDTAEFDGEIVAFYVLQEDNPDMYSDVTFDISDGKLSYGVSFLYDIDYFSHCKPKILCSDGVTSVFPDECMNSDGTVNLTENASVICTDANGTQKTYTVEISRQPLNLPVVELEFDGDISDISRDEYSSAVFSMSNPEYGDISSASVSIRGRGHSTWKWDKKPLRIKFDTATSLFGLEAKKDWVLLANHSDKSLIRNTVAHKMSELLDGIKFKFHQYPVDLFINGKYQGVYSIGEKIEVNEGRVDIDEDYTDTDTGYLIECGGVDDEVDVKGVDFFHTKTIKFLRIKSPDTKVMSQAHFDFISDYFTKADEAIRTLDGYEEYIDVESFIDWFILQELSYNLDSCFRRSCYMYKEKGGKIFMSPAWDFDLAFGNFSSDNKAYDDFATEGADGEDEYIKITWFNYLLQDEAFRTKLRDRWDLIGEKLCEQTLEYIDGYYAIVKPSADMNFAVWDILDEKTGYQPSFMKKYNTYEKQIDYLKNFIISRFKYLDKNI